MDISMQKVIADSYGPMTASVYDQIAYELFWAYGPTLEALASEAIHSLPYETFCLKENFKILDLGAGTGNLSEHVLQKLKQVRSLYGKDNKVELVLFDQSPAMLANAQEKLKGFEFVNLQIKTGNLKEFAHFFQNHSFDLIVSSFSIHHLDEFEKKNLFQAISQSLSQGSLFILADRIVGETSEFEKINFRVAASRFIEKCPHVQNIDQIVEILNHQFAADGDQPSKLSEQLQWLNQTRFINVRCVFQSYMNVVLRAQKN